MAIIAGQRQRLLHPSPAAAQEAFLAAYAKLGTYVSACKAAHVGTMTLREWRRDPEFLRRLAEAYTDFAEALEGVAIQRAVEGVRRPVLYHGDQVRVPDPEATGPWSRRRKIPLYEHTYSDGLLTTLLKAAKPDKYAERSETRTTSLNVTIAGPQPSWWPDRPAGGLPEVNATRRITTTTRQTSPRGAVDALLEQAADALTDDDEG